MTAGPSILHWPGLRKLGIVTAILCDIVATPAWTGPPYGTDDPDPPESGHWEIYALVADEGHGGIVKGETGVEASYGAAPNLQLSAAVPMGFAHDEKLDSHRAI